MAFFKFNLTEDRGTVMINEDEIQVISEIKGKCTEIYLKGQSDNKCFAVTATIREIEKKLKQRNYDIPNTWC